MPKIFYAAGTIIIAACAAFYFVQQQPPQHHAHPYISVSLNSPFNSSPLLHELQTRIANSINDTLQEIVAANPGLQHSAAHTRDKKMVRTEHVLHVTYLTFGDVSEQVLPCVAQTTLAHLNENSDALATLQPTINFNQHTRLRLFNNVVVLELDPAHIQLWDLAHTLPPQLTQHCSISAVHFSHYRHSQFRPHISLLKLSDRKLLNMTDAQSGKKVRTIIHAALDTVTRELMQEHAQPMNLGVLDLTTIYLTKKMHKQVQPVARFTHDAATQQWAQANLQPVGAMH